MPHKTLLVALALALVVTRFNGLSDFRPAEAGINEPGKPAGLERRTPWTTPRVRGSPDRPRPYRTELAFPKLKFDEPLDISGAPGSSRLFVVERYGRVFSFPNDPKTDRADL